MALVVLVFVDEDSQRLKQIQGWSRLLRVVANRLLNDGDHEMANHFYGVHYAIGPDDEQAEFDQFALDEDYLALAESGGMAKLIENLRVVIQNGERFVGAGIWNGGLGKYLDDLLVHLTSGK